MQTSLDFLRKAAAVKWIFLLLLFVREVHAKPHEPETYVLQKVLAPWVAAHYPKFHYIGKESSSESAFSWRFQDRDDPKLQTTFPLDIEMNFVQSASTAHRYLHRGDVAWKSLKSGRVPTQIGDESKGFDKTATGNLQDQGAIGGWVSCRVGVCLFFVRSYSVTFDDLKDLSERIAKAIPLLPRPSSSLCKKTEIDFRRAIFQVEQAKREDDEYEQRLKAKTFVTAGELYENHLQEHPTPEMTYDNEGLSPGARSHTVESHVSEIALERPGSYAVKITRDGKVEYFGGRNVRMLGNHTGHIPEWKFQQIAEFITDSKVDTFHDAYESAETCERIVFTSFVIDGKQKLISNYANSGPSSLWAIEQLIDQLVAETEWETGKKRVRAKESAVFLKNP